MIKIEVQSTRAVIRYQEPLTVGLRGAKAHFVFGDGWDGLVKTAVFRQGDKTVAVADIDAEVTVPWEVLTQPGLPVQIGVYGTNGNQVAIPTLWAVTKPVRPGTDPEADPSAEPTPGLWEQMQGKLDNLEASVNEVSRAVKVTITQNADGSYTADRYCEELLDAHNAGYTVYCQYGSRVFPLLLAARSQVAFGCVYADQTHTVMIGRQSASVVSKTLAAGDGITPHIGANGNWFIGETDTGMPSRGEDAPKEAVLYTPQDLTPEQQAQARQNIGATADLAAGGGIKLPELIASGTMEEEGFGFDITKDNDGNPFELVTAILYVTNLTPPEGTTSDVLCKIMMRGAGGRIVYLRANATQSAKKDKITIVYDATRGMMYAVQDHYATMISSGGEKCLYPVNRVDLQGVSTWAIVGAGLTYELWGVRK